MIERLAQCHYLKEMRPSGDPEGLHFRVQFDVINVRFGSLADIVQRPRHVCFTPIADVRLARSRVRYVSQADRQ